MPYVVITCDLSVSSFLKRNAPLSAFQFHLQIPTLISGKTLASVEMQRECRRTPMFIQNLRQKDYA